MQRPSLLLSQAVLRFLTLAISVVVGFEVGPRLSAHAASAPVVCAADQKVSEDTVKAGERLEPRVSPARVVDRLPPARLPGRHGAVSGADRALELATFAFDCRSDGERLPIVKHVPRMERGDPPRT